MVLDNFHGGFLKVRGSQRYSRWPGRTYRTKISKTRRAKAPCSKENFSAARKTPAQSRSPKQTSRSRKLDFRWDSRCTGGGTLLAQNKHAMQGLGPPPTPFGGTEVEVACQSKRAPNSLVGFASADKLRAARSGRTDIWSKKLGPPLPKPPKQKLLIIAKQKLVPVCAESGEHHKGLTWTNRQAEIGK